jgi:hypothetical protein
MFLLFEVFLHCELPEGKRLATVAGVEQGRHWYRASSCR